MDKNDNKQTTRVELYADLRNQIDKMDTLSFDDPNAKEKYAQTLNQGPVIHEESISPSQSYDPKIKKNTLSISIGELIKQNDDYTIALEKKDINKSFKEIKKRNMISKKSLFFLIGGIALLIIIIVVIILCVVLI